MALEFDGKKYRQASEHQQEWGARLLAELALRGDERILDLGCGDGRLTAQLAEGVPAGSVLGIDASAGMIEAAREHQRPNLAFRLLDINELDFESEFDVLFSNATLHWVKDHRRLLGNSLRALRPGGILQLNFAAEGNCSHLFAVLREVLPQARYAEHFRGFEWPWYMPEVDEYRALVQEFAFREAKVWGENADRFFPTVDAMVGWVDQPSLVPFLKHVGEPDRQAFRDAVIERMTEVTRQPDGRCFETFRRVNVFARK
jgi:trans-aconitate methyltransferase